MPPTDHLIAFTITCAVVVLIPGPSVLFTVGRALSLGRRGALLTVVGNATGVYIQVVFVAAGLGAVVATSATAYTAVKVAGALYLIWLGVQAIRHRQSWAEARPDAALPRGAWRILRQGLVVGVTNPKMIIFLTAVLPQFTDTGRSVGPQILVLGAIVVAIALVCDSLWALAAGTARAWFARSPGRIRAMSGVGGAAMIGLGATFLVAGGHE
ncbi:MAG TPA: LysE family translocator [Nocardioidaceae bacterium]|nr:LysE family translocator [Nocardioidaceae bacterium]